MSCSGYRHLQNAIIVKCKCTLEAILHFIHVHVLRLRHLVHTFAVCNYFPAVSTLLSKKDLTLANYSTPVLVIYIGNNFLPIQVETKRNVIIEPIMLLIQPQVWIAFTFNMDHDGVETTVSKRPGIRSLDHSLS